MARAVRVAGLLVVGVFAACGGGAGQTSSAGPSPTSETPTSGTPAAGTPTSESPPPADATPVVKGHWTYYGALQGLSPDIQDVSADEGGNVYVAGGDALYAKRRADRKFLRFDAANAGFTQNCNSADNLLVETPATPFYMCRVLSVAGAAPGKAIIGFEGFGYLPVAAQWAIHAGGADVVSFDPDKGTASRVRHVFIASPPHVVCGGDGGEDRAPPGFVCPNPNDFWWNFGRRLVHRIRRIVVNHDLGSALYGDVWFSGEHGTFSVLLANADARGLLDRTAGWGAEWVDAKDVWEHLHPNISPPDGDFINGEGWALSIDPRSGIPWGSNGYRTSFVGGYGSDLSGDQWGLLPWNPPPPIAGIDIWPDAPDAWTNPVGFVDTPYADDVHSISHCPDGTLWVGSTSKGLARIDTTAAISKFTDPAIGTNLATVACDPSDASVWIGLVQGGIVRLKDGVFSPVDVSGVPDFARQMVQSIQIDRWSSPRILYFAFAPTIDAGGAITSGGGVASYDGP